jgi:hypothetical protein
MKSLLVGVKNILLWSYARGTWQYDLLCLLIVATIFLAPSRFFGDRDRGGGFEANPRAVFASKPSDGTVDIAVTDLKSFLEKRNRIDLLNSPRDAVVLYLRARNQGEAAEIADIELITTPAGESAYRVRLK